MVLVQIEDVDLRLIHICTGPEQELQLGEVWVIFWVEAWKTPTWSWDPRTSTDRHQSGWCDLCCPQTPGWQRKELKNTSTWSWEWDLLSEKKDSTNCHWKGHPVFVVVYFSWYQKWYCEHPCLTLLIQSKKIKFQRKEVCTIDVHLILLHQTITRFLQSPSKNCNLFKTTGGNGFLNNLKKN